MNSEIEMDAHSSTTSDSGSDGDYGGRKVAICFSAVRIAEKQVLQPKKASTFIVKLFDPLFCSKLL